MLTEKFRKIAEKSEKYQKNTAQLCIGTALLCPSAEGAVPLMLT